MIQKDRIVPLITSPNIFGKILITLYELYTHVFTHTVQDYVFK